jgi:hypothetical protein
MKREGVWMLGNCGVRPWRGNGVIAIDLLPNGKIIAIWVVTQPVLT